MERAVANGRHQKGQLPASLGPFCDGRKPHGDIYGLLRSNYASKAHDKHPPPLPNLHSDA